MTSRDDLAFLLDHINETAEVVDTRYVYFPIRPQAKQSARMGFSGSVHADPKKKAYVGKLRAHVASLWAGKEPATGPVSLTIYYCFKWPKKQKTRAERLGWDFYTSVPDLDNLSKPVKDALKGVAYLDDSQVVDLHVRKIRYPEEGILLKMQEILPIYLDIPE